MTKRRIEKFTSECEQFEGDILSMSFNDNRRIVVFVSHSSTDNEFIKKDALFLRYSKGGVKRYVDWQDPKCSTQ